MSQETPEDVTRVNWASSTGEQNLGDAFAKLGRQLGNALTDMGFVLAGQGAMGWMLQGEPDKAVEALSNLDDRQATVVADAADMLATMIRGSRA